MLYGVIVAISKHVIAKETLAGGGIGVGVDEAAGSGVVITGLQIVQPGLLVEELANGAKMAWFLLFPEGVFPSEVCGCFRLEQQPGLRKL